MKYKIVVSLDVNDLEEKVQKFLNKGWELQGEIFVDRSGNIYQAMIKKEEIIKKKD